MQRRNLMAGAALASAFATCGTQPGNAALPASPLNVEDLGPKLSPLLAQYGIPALAGAVARGGVIVAAGAVGTRRAGADVPVTLHDPFHIGSDTKAMTSLLAAMVLEAGKLRWDSTLGQVYPELAGDMDAGLRAVTLLQLLSHTSGLPSDNRAFGDLLTQSFTLDSLNLDEMRAWLVREWRHNPLAAPAGTRFAYSNLGYTIAGAMIERVSGRSWEELIVERIFTPLNLRTAGFGPPSRQGRVDAPLGHVIRADGTLKPMMAGPGADNPAIIGPAGTVHLSILDFAIWAGWHAGEGRRGPPLVQPGTLRKLHTKVIEIPPPPVPTPGRPGGGAYCLGWGIAQLPFTPHPVLTHTGSNNMNLALVIVDVPRDMALVVAANIAGDRADAGLRRAAKILYAT